MGISLDLIKQLRELTGAGVMECRKALEKSEGDLAKAKIYLKKHFVEKAEKKADRETKQGVVESYIHANGKI
ncbi:elongation factor Ts, partial [Candidatus Gottesmanbacteria bacterium]|nr:elongation factor Ts [Candidatus Gottesmanbacteria bacterium]